MTNHIETHIRNMIIERTSYQESVDDIDSGVRLPSFGADGMPNLQELSEERADSAFTIRYLDALIGEMTETLERLRRGS